MTVVYSSEFVGYTLYEYNEENQFQFFLTKTVI